MQPDPPQRRGMLSELDAEAQQAMAIGRAVYALLRPFLAPLRRISGYVSRDRLRREDRTG